MTDTPFQLITLLSEKRDLLEEVLPFLEEEHRCIMEMDMARLTAIMEQKTEILQRLQETGKRCRILLNQLAAELGSPELKSLTPLLPKLEASQQEVLRALQGEILESGASFERLLNSNGDLLGGALLTVNRSLEFFGRLLNRSTTYGDAGRMVGGANRARMVCREV